MDIWKVNEFNFLNEEVEEFTRRWSLNLVTVKCPSSLKQENHQILFMRQKQIIVYSVFPSDMVIYSKCMVRYIHICIMIFMHDKLMW